MSKVGLLIVITWMMSGNRIIVMIIMRHLRLLI